MEEIKIELRQDNISVKTNAVAKLTYVRINLKLLLEGIETIQIKVYHHI